MSRLNAIRIINLIYNYKTIHVNDLLFELNNMTTLIRLDNGAGKSVLTQMVTSANVTEGARNMRDRKFAEYFPTTKPTFILEEFKLEQNAGYMMCGLMVRRNPNFGKTGAANDNELDVIGLVSEYGFPCEQDIRHLPVTEEKDEKLILKSFSSCARLFEEYKKDSRCRFYVYNLNVSGAQTRYLEKLAENGVYSGEWKNIIKKANAGEGENSGLAGVFKDCKNERGLIEKWLLPAIEGNLSRDRDRGLTKDFRETIAKYIHECFQNDEKIRAKSSIEHFLVKADEMMDSARDYQSECSEQDTQKNRLSCFGTELGRLEAAAAVTKEKEEAAAEETAEKIRATEHERLSMEYAVKKEELRGKQTELAILTGQIARLEKDKKIFRHSLNVLKLAERQGRVNDALFEVQQKQQALEISLRAEEDLKPEKNYLGYRLRCLYEEKVSRLTEELAKIDCSYRESLFSRNAATARKTAAEEELIRQNGLLGTLQAQVRGYDEKEGRYLKKWNRVLSRNMFGVYPDGTLDAAMGLVDGDIAAHEKDAEEKERAKASVSEELARAREQKDRLRDELHELNDALSGENARLSSLSEQLEYRKKALIYLGLDEGSLYDKDAILEASGRKIAEVEQIIGRLTVETERLEEEVRIMKTGKISGVQKELRNELDRLGINIVYGMEWLKKNGKSEEENLEIIRKCPFLPYSLVMTNKEAERLSASDRRIYTSAPVPIVTREAVANADGCSPNVEGVQFYMYFNESLLNEERLNALIAEKEGLISDKKGEIEEHRQEHHGYITRRDRIAAQDVTYDILEGSRRTVLQLAEKIKQNKDSAHDVQGLIPVLEEKLRSIDRRIADMKLVLAANRNEKEELAELREAYSVYKRDMSALAECSDKIETLKNDRNNANREYETAEAELRQLDMKRSDREREKDLTVNESAEFMGYNAVSAPEGFDCSLQDSSQLLLARYRAIIENASAEEKRLSREIAEAQGRLTKEKRALDSMAKRYGLQEPDWISWNYEASEEAKTEASLRQAEEDLRSTEDAQGTLRGNIISIEKDCSYILSEMKRICGDVEPLEENEVPRIDFAEKKRLLEAEELVHTESAKKAEKRCDGISSTRKLLAGYDNAEPSEQIEFEEDFSSFDTSGLQTYAVDLIRQYRSLEKSVAKKKDSVEKLIRKAKDDSMLQGSYFRVPIETLLSITDDACGLLQQISILRRSYNGTLEKLKVDIEFMEKNKAHIADTLEEYLERVHLHMNKIDKNATILIDEKPTKMLKITLPDWEEMHRIYRLNLERYIEELTSQGIRSLKAGSGIDGILEKTVTTKNLFDRVVGIENVKITLYKVESYGGKILTWEQAAKNSGGEGTLSAFVIVTSLISYMRSRETDVLAEKNEGKVLLLDNPFGSTSSKHLLAPMFQLAEKNNIQMVCFTALTDASITNIFNNAYVVRKIPSSIGNTNYLVSEHTKGKEPEDLLTIRVEVTDEQLSLF